MEELWRRHELGTGSRHLTAYGLQPAQRRLRCARNRYVSWYAGRDGLSGCGVVTVVMDNGHAHSIPQIYPPFTHLPVAG